MTTAERMKRRRKELGLSAEYVADRLGCSPTTVYRYEKGDIEKMPLDILKPLSTILCTSPAYLMGWDEDAPSTPVPGKEQLQAAFWGGDKDLTQDEKDAMWDDVERFAAFLAQQKKQEKQKDD